MLGFTAMRELLLARELQCNAATTHIYAAVLVNLFQYRSGVQIKVVSRVWQLRRSGHFLGSGIVLVLALMMRGDTVYHQALCLQKTPVTVCAGDV